MTVECQHIFGKLGYEPNEMQVAVDDAVGTADDIVLLAPTGSGKTLAYALVVAHHLQQPSLSPSAVVLAPSRELATQIYGVLRHVLDGCKVVTVSGGHSSDDQRRSLEQGAAVIVATPGRLQDLVERGIARLSEVRCVVIDEYDQCLELGFEAQMRHVLAAVPHDCRHVLASATAAVALPRFVTLRDCRVLDYRASRDNAPEDRLRQWQVAAGSDKQQALRSLLLSLPADSKTMVFVSFRDSVASLVSYLNQHGITAIGYHGALDQHRREAALKSFEAGAAPVIVTTDLAGRGIDIVDVDNVVHYHLPQNPETLTHRNGRTARVEVSGNAFFIVGSGEVLPTEVGECPAWTAERLAESLPARMEMLHFAAGRREKLSAGDIVGFLTAQCGLQGDEIGKIFVGDHYALVAVPRGRGAAITASHRNARIKHRTIRITPLY